MRDVHLSLASATEHKLTGGEYLGRKPVGLQDFEAVGLVQYSTQARMGNSSARYALCKLHVRAGRRITCHAVVAAEWKDAHL